MPTLLCPSENQLLAFTLGRTDPELAKDIARHLGNCPSCETVMVACMQQSMHSMSLHSVRTVDGQPELHAVQNPHERYRIEKTLGVGGMGIVYLAQDLQLGRTVALKLVHASLSGQGFGAQARLLREAQTMAKLNHPHMVPVYDVGLFDDRLFFTMEYIEGQTLREFLTERPTAALQRGERLAVFAAIGSAIAAAHNAGVIHGDLKPENILIRHDKMVKVADFGLAHLENQHRTETDMSLPQIVGGTPAYMAPEQKWQQATAQSDQYSFCLMLYEAMAEERWMPTAVGSAAWQKIPKFLKPILLRGLATLPAQRYPSMERLLLDWPAPAVGFKRYWIWGGILILLLNVFGILGWQRYVRQAQRWQCQAGTRQMAEVWNAKSRQKLAQRFLHSALPFAMDLLPRVDQALDAYFQKWAAQFAQICTLTASTPFETQPSMQQKECLQERLYEATKLLQLFDNRDDKLLERSVAMVQQLPELNCQTVLANQAAATLSSAQREQMRSWRLTLVDVRLLRNAGQLRDAEQKVQPLIAQTAAQQLFGMQARALYSLGDIQTVMGKLPAAEQSLLQAVDVAEANQEDLVAAQAWTGMVLNDCRQLKLAEGYAHARRAQAAIARLGDPEELLSELDNNMGCLLQRENRHREAVARIEQAIARHRTKHGELSLSMASVYNNVALSYWRLGRKKEGLAAAKNGLEIIETVLGKHHPQIAIPLQVIGNFLAEDGDSAGSIPYLLRALSLLEKTPNPGMLGFVHYNLGISYEEIGQKAKALAEYRQALKIRQELLDPQSEAVKEVEQAIKKLEK